MIITRIMGGLGNQMFQYALGRRLALERNVPLKLDLNWYNHQQERYFELNEYNIQAEVASNEEIYLVKNFSRNRYLRKVFTIYQKYINKYQRRVIEEETSGTYNPDILKAARKCYLNGYWQSENYFKPFAHKIRQEFTLNGPLSMPEQAMAKEIRENPNSVSVHIRRGDYLSGKTGHWLCDLDYYHRAIQYIKAQVQSPQFYFFSDDISWVKSNFPQTSQEIFIEPRIDSKSYLDMYLIMQCRHHINANSSFSWWGAWMGEQNNSLVVIPNKWFQNVSYPVDLVPERWFRL